MLSVFPFQVLDRELDLCIFNSILMAVKGYTCLIGDENNIEPILLNYDELFVAKHASPTANPRRRKWNESVIKNRGINIGFNLEGCNNVPFDLTHVGAHKSNYSLAPLPGMPNTSELNLEMYTQQISFKTYQSKYSQKYEALGLPFLNDLPRSSSIVTGDPREILTTKFGKYLFHERSSALKHLIGSPFILVPDNFTVDSFGMFKKGVLDPTQDYLKAGNSQSDIDQYLESLNQMLEAEKIARERFAKIITKLASDLPHIPFVIRPHPVLDPSYWLLKFATFRNIIVLYRDSIYPWLHSACAVLHSGCTTGYEAARAHNNVADLGHLIDHSKPSLSSLVSFQPTSFAELSKFVQKSFLADSLPISGTKPSSTPVVASENYSSSEKFNRTETLLSQLKPFLDHSTGHIHSLAHNLLNKEYIFPHNCFLEIIDFNSSVCDFPSKAMFLETVVSLRRDLSNHPPVYLKSRHLDFGDIRNRYLSFLSALSLNHLQPLLAQVASNTFLFSLRPSVIPSQVSIKSPALERSVIKPSPHTSPYSVDPSGYISFQQLMKVGWPGNATDHYRHSLQISNVIEDCLNTNSFKSSSVQDLMTQKSSDTVFIFGSAPSINKLQPVDFELFSQHDSIGLNNFIVHKFNTTIQLYEAATAHHLEFLASIRPIKLSSSPLILNARHLLPIIDQFRSFSFFDNNLRLINPLIFKSVSTSCFTNLLSQVYNQSFKRCFHARGSLSIAHSLAISMGYKKVVLVGFELDSNNYFYQDHAYDSLSPSVTPILDKLMYHQQEFASKAYKIKSPLFNDKIPHFTVSNQISQTLNILDIMSISSAQAKLLLGIDTFLYREEGLLAKVLPIYQ